MLPGDVTNYLYANDMTQIIMVGARGMKMPGETDASLLLTANLVSGETAYIRNFDETLSAEQISVARQEDDLTGQFALALTADRAYSDGTRSRMFAVGSSAIFTDSTGFMFSNTYSGEMMLYATQYLSGKETISLDILPREAVRPQLDYTDMFLPVMLLTLAPLSVLVAAVAILRPRKHL